jgi:hypothetical protein
VVPERQVADDHVVESPLHSAGGCRLTVDRRTSRELRAMAKGRIAFIDYVAYAGTRGLRVGRVWLRWLDECAPIPDRVVRVSGIAEPVLIRAELVRSWSRSVLS